MTPRPRSLQGDAALAPTRYLALREAAARYDVSVVTLRRRIIDGSLPAVQAGRRIIRVNTVDLERLFKPVQSVRSVQGR